MPKKVTKSDLIEKIYNSENIDKEQISKVIDYMLVAVKESLEDGATIELRGFGTFEPRLRKGKSVARNPKTGEIVSVEPHYVAAFRAGKDLKNNLWNLKIKDEK